VNDTKSSSLAVQTVNDTESSSLAVQTVNDAESNSRSEGIVANNCGRFRFKYEWGTVAVHRMVTNRSRVREKEWER
jgi:hypothetical protein